MTDSPMDSFDLLEAGKTYFNAKNFDYKSKEQMAFTTIVLLSDKRKVAGLQTFAGFGKSLTYILPMMVLKKCSKIHYVNFICVPYKTMIVPIIKKLKTGGLHVEEMLEFTSFVEDRFLSNIDVFVGCPDSFGDDKTIDIFKNWESLYTPKNQLGYLVFEEAHHFSAGAQCEKSVGNIRDLSWEKWRKTLLLSATMDRTMYHNMLEERKIPDAIIDTSLFIDSIYKVPEVNIEIDVERIENNEIITEATRLICNFANHTSDVNAVFFFWVKRYVASGLR